MGVAISESGSSVVLNDIRWETFEAIADDMRGGRLTYDGERLEIMSPSMPHEAAKSLLGRLVEVWTEEKGIDIKNLASMTLKRRDLAKGLEPDECFYVQHIAAVLGKRQLDFEHDPPPDLAIEVEVSSTVLPRMPIYAALGVPEVWRHTGGQIVIERLGEDGAYHAAEQSGIFPGLPIDQLPRFIERARDESDTAVIRAFRAFIRDRDS